MFQYFFPRDDMLFGGNREMLVERDNRRSKFLGTMVGSALGDAIGEMAFSLRGEAQIREAVAEAEVLRYTDDTAMAIGLAECLSNSGTIEEKILGDIFKRNYNREPWRGYALGPPSVFDLVDKHGLGYAEAAAKLFRGEGDYVIISDGLRKILPRGRWESNRPKVYDQSYALPFG